MKWRGKKQREKLLHMDKSRILVIDTETTGITPANNELLQVTIVDGYGTLLFDSYIRPQKRKSWKSAYKVNGITYEMVENAPEFHEVRAEIQKLIDKAKVLVGYNINFDIKFLEAVGIIILSDTFDVMYEFADFRASIDGTMYRTYKLVNCAEYYSYLFTAHNSRNDALATLHCFDKMINDKRFINCNKSIHNKVMRIGYVRNTRMPRYIRKFVISIAVLIIGEGILLYCNKKFLVDMNSYILPFKNLITGSDEFNIEHFALLLIGTGVVFVVIYAIKMLSYLPKWMIAKLRKLFS